MKYMPSVSEKTHAGNRDNLHIANGIITEIGSIFAPVSEMIKATDLNTFETTFSNNLEGVNDAFSLEDAKVKQQIREFNKVPKRVTKIMNAARGLGLSAETLASLQTTVNKINGFRATSKTPDNPATPEDESRSNISVSQRSYAGLLESLDLLHAKLAADPAYVPNEAEHKTTAIETWIDGLRTLHNDAIAAKLATVTARHKRDSHAYNPATGIIPRTKALKAYAASILEKDDPRLIRLKKLRFVDFSK